MTEAENANKGGAVKGSGRGCASKATAALPKEPAEPGCCGGNDRSGNARQDALAHVGYFFVVLFCCCWRLRYWSLFFCCCWLAVLLPWPSALDAPTFGFAAGFAGCCACAEAQKSIAAAMQ